MANIPDLKLEGKLRQAGYTHVIAIDEVGFGALAGPVVVCAVLIPLAKLKKKDLLLKLRVRDSKQLTAAQRERVALALGSDSRLHFQICSAQPKTIDRLNIYQATRMAMRRAIRNLEFKILNLKLRPIVLIDGNRTIAGLDLPQRAIVRGDQKVFSIAAASIMAKVYRDKTMVNYDKRYPGYGFKNHKGYGTKYHLIQLAILGPSVIHRKSFAPISDLL